MNRPFKRSLSIAGLIAALSLLSLHEFVLASAPGKAPASPQPSATVTQSVTASYAESRVLVKFKLGVSSQAIQQQAQTESAQVQAAPELARLGVLVLKVPPGKVLQVVAHLKQNPAVEFAEPDYQVQAVDTIPNDPYWGSQYGPANIQAPQAWDITIGSSSVAIAVIDTGADLTHPELASKIWNNPYEVAGNGVDDDCDGYIDDWRGWDFYNHDNNPQDDHGHGTHVSGIAAASSNNSVGIAGIAWGARLMPLKVLSNAGYGSESDVASAMTWAADHGAKVINLSLGGSDASAVMEAAVNYAYAHGVTIAAAAGNSGSSSVLYPAAYSNTIAVASTDSGNNRSWFSTYGPEVDLAAPGENIYSTYLGGGYGYMSGTSMATPHVAGVAALLAGLPQYDTPAKIRAALQNTALDLPEVGWDQYSGYGLVQAYAALLFDPVTPTPTPTPTITPTPAVVYYFPYLAKSC